MGGYIYNGSPCTSDILWKILVKMAFPKVPRNETTTQAFSIISTLIMTVGDKTQIFPKKGYFVFNPVFSSKKGIFFTFLHINIV